MQEKKVAYQIQGILSYLRDIGYDYSDACTICENSNVDSLRYKFNIPDEAVNKYWYKALGM